MTSKDEKVDAWMPLWIGSYLADTMDLTRDEHGGYLLLLIAYWRNKGPLPDIEKKMRTITRCEGAADWRRLRETLAPFFTIEDGVWRHGRADKELAKAGAHKAAATKKAQAGAEARWGKDRKQPPLDAPSIAPGNAPSIDGAVPKQCPTPTPLPSSLRSDSDPDGSDADGVPPPPPAADRVLITDPDEIIFGYGVPILTSAGNADKQARSFLGGLRKVHGDVALIDALRRCIREKPLQPLEWLAAALPPKPGKGKQSAVESRNAAVVDALIGESA